MPWMTSTISLNKKKRGGIVAVHEMEKKGKKKAAISQAKDHSRSLERCLNKRESAQPAHSFKEGKGDCRREKKKRGRRTDAFT